MRFAVIEDLVSEFLHQISVGIFCSFYTQMSQMSVSGHQMMH